MRKPAFPEITPLELAELIERGEDIQVLDVRAPARVNAGGRIDLLPDGRFHNIVGSRLALMRSPDEVGLDRETPVAVVCGHGNASKPATLHLTQLGYRARSLAGGMAAWMLLAYPRRLEPTPSLDHLIQFDRVGKGALGYLLGSDGQALIIDPPRDPEPFLAKMHELGLGLVGVADTHVHADYISGAPALAAMAGVPYYLHPADAVYPYDGTPGRVSFTPIADGQTIALGRAAIGVVHTPGHTEGSVTYMVDDLAAFTGDFVFVQSLGRPDLAGKTEAWTGTLWRSVVRAKAEWPDDLIIYPAHYASAKERRPDRTIAAPWGELKQHNVALTLQSEDDFRSWVRSKSGAFPEAYREIKAVNVGLRDVTGFEAEELEVGKNECAIA